MITPGLTSYEVVLQDKYFLREVVEKISLEERLEEVAMRGNVRLLVPGPEIVDQYYGLPVILPGHEMRISGVPSSGGNMVCLLQPGVVWDVNIDNSQRRHWDITIYDRTIYMAKSDDEYFFAEGTTATERIKQIATDWQIPIYSLAETGIPLAKAMHRAKSIWSIIQETLAETAEKSNKMYRLRMVPGKENGGLELIEIGSNKDVWVLEFCSNLENVKQHQTLDGAVTQVKILGNESKDKRSPVTAVIKGEISQLGTLQKIHTQGQKNTDKAAAEKAAQNMLAGIQETVSVTALDINTIRAGDHVHVDGWPELIAISVKHECGSPGRMSLELAKREYIRRKYYAGRSV